MLHWQFEMLAESVKFLNILTSQYFEVLSGSPTASLSFSIATFQQLQSLGF